MGDVKFSARSLARNRGFTAAALITLTLGIGANTTIFTIVNALLLRPLPFADPNRLVMVWERNTLHDRRTNVISPGNFIHWREQNHSFTELGGFSLTMRTTLMGTNGPEELPMQYATPELFSVLGVRPEIGRWFRPDEALGNVVTISHGLWVHRFNRDPSIVGRAVTLNGEPYTVTGVMPPGFIVADRDVQLWIALGFKAEARTPRGRWMIAIGRLRPGVTVPQAQADTDQIAGRLAQEFPEIDTGWATTVVPLQEQLTGGIRPALLILLAAVGCVLLIACANVANLLLARGAGRRRELAIRGALGASRGALIRQLLTESVLLSTSGGLLGLLAAWWGVGALRAVMASTIPLLPRVDEIVIDWRILAFTAAVSVVTGLLFGLVPALVSSESDLQDALREGGRTSSGRESLLRNAFVVLEVALALVLLTGAGLLIRSFARLSQVDPGFATDHALTARVSVSGPRYEEPARVRAFFNDLMDRLQHEHGIKTAGGISFLPMTGLAAATNFEVVGQPKPPLGQEPGCEVRVVSGDYFGAMGMRVIAGRVFTSREQHDPARVAIVNEKFARQYWPDESAIGRKIVVSWNDEGEDEIVGVVSDNYMYDLETAPRPAVYWPMGRFAYPWSAIVVRTEGDPLAAVSVIRRDVEAIDRNAPVADMRTLDEVLSRSTAQRRLTMVLLGLFAAIALTLAIVGIYGVTSYVVAQRTREIGVRIALGASRADVMRLVLGRAMVLALIGGAAGSVAAWGVTRFMKLLLFETTPTDPFIFSSVAVLLLAAAVGAGYIPGRSAVKVDPVVALRSE